MLTRHARLMHHLHRLVPAAATQTDAELLDLYVRLRDEAAFAALVRRHGSMVLCACRRVLADFHTAEDAFQATFLALARQAGSIRRPEALTAWLHGTAQRIAWKVRTTARRCPAEMPAGATAPADPRPDPLSQVTARELLTILDEEVQRLPEANRLAIILCCLEGKPSEEAALQLGCTTGSLRGQLVRGRALLHARLVRRGVTLAAALSIAEVARETATAALVAGTVRAALAFAETGAAGAQVPVGAARLASGVLGGAGMGTAKLALVLLLLLGLTAIGARTLTQHIPGEPPAQNTAGDEALAKDDRTEQSRSKGIEGLDVHGDALPNSAVARLGTIRFRDLHGFQTLAYTPDGKFLVSGGWGGVVWDAVTGKEIRRLGTELPGAHGPVSLSSDGKRVAVGGWGPDKDTAGAVYDVATGRRLYPFGNRGGATFSARFSRDGKLLAVYGLDRKIQLHDAQTGKRLHELAGHKLGEGVGNTIADVVFSPDTKLLISAGADGTIRQWDIATAKEMLQLNAGADGVVYVALSPDGTLLASHAWVKKERGPGQFVYTYENRLRLWNMNSGKETDPIRLPSRTDRTDLGMDSLVGFTPDGKSIMTGGPDGVLRVWDVRTGKESSHVNCPDGSPRAVAFAPDGKTMARIEGFRAIRIREYPSGRESIRLDGHGDAIEGIAIAPNGNTVATASDGGAILLWDRATSQLKARLAAPDRPRTLIFSPDAKTLFTVGYDQPLQAWAVATGKERWRMEAKHDRAIQLSLAPDGKTIAWSGKLNTILLIDTGTGKAVRELEAPKSSLNGLCFSANGSTLLAWDDSKRLMRWDVKTGQWQEKPLEGLADNPFAVTFSPDGDLIVFGGQVGDLILVRVATGRVVHRVATAPVESRGQENGVFCAVFSPDGRTLAWSGPEDGQVRLSEVATGKERRRLPGHRGRVNALAFSFDGNILVSGAEDTTGLVWDLTGPLAWGKTPPGPLNEVSLKACWEQLHGDDAAIAYLAIRRLIADTVRAVPFLAKRLNPAVPPNEQRVSRLIADIDSDDFGARDGAAKELERTGDSVLPALRKGLAGKSSLEMRRRIEQLVERLETITSERLRIVRAIEALEYAATPQARRLLEALAHGAPGALQTHEAKSSLNRLANRNPAQP